MNNPCLNCEHFLSCRRQDCNKYWKYQDYLFERRKWIKGATIRTINELLSQPVIWVNDKPVNKAFFQNWQLAHLIILLNRGDIHYCQRNPLYKGRFRREENRM